MPERYLPPPAKVYHRFGLVNQHGHVSALCFKKPHAIDLSKALWTIRDQAVTCPRCRKLIRERAPEPKQMEATANV